MAGAISSPGRRTPGYDGASARSNLKSEVRDRGSACVTEGPVRNSGPYGRRRSPMVSALTAHSAR